VLDKNLNNNHLIIEYLNKKSNSFEIDQMNSSDRFSSFKLLKQKDKISLNNFACYLYQDLI